MNNFKGKFIKYVRNFHRTQVKGEMGRYYQWNILREVVLKNMNNVNKGERHNSEELSVHLGMYLASWGMYRGSSVLLRVFSSNVYLGLIDSLFKDDRYFELSNITRVDQLTEERIDLIGELYDEISTYLSNVFNKYLEKGKKKYEPKTVSHTLVTKIITGIYGCSIAYDRYISLSLSDIRQDKLFESSALQTVQNGDSIKRSIKGLINILKEVRHLESKNGIPILKELDVALFEYGSELEKEIKSSKLNNEKK